MARIDDMLAALHRHLRDIPECSCTSTVICSWCAEYLPRDTQMYPREDQWEMLRQYVNDMITRGRGDV